MPEMEHATSTDPRELLAASLEQSKHELESAVEELKDVARDKLTPGEVLARRRYVWIAGAFAIGLILSRR